MAKKNGTIYVVVREDNYDRPYSPAVIMFNGKRMSYQQATEHAGNALATDCLVHDCDGLSAPYYYTIMPWERAEELANYRNGTRY